MRAFLLALAAGCAAPGDEPAPRVAAPDDEPRDSADPGDPDDTAGDPTDTGDDTPPTEPSGCDVLSPSRSRCGLLTAGYDPEGSAPPPPTTRDADHARCQPT